MYGVFAIFMVSVVVTRPQVQADPMQQTVLGNWEAVTSPTTSRLSGVEVVSNDDVYAVGGAYPDSQDPIVLHYNGTEWLINSTVNSSNQHFKDVSFSDADHGWGVGYQTRSEYNGSSWNHQSPNAEFLYGVDMVNANFGINVGFYYQFSSGITHYGAIQTYNGSVWQETSTRLDETYLDVDMLNADEGWIVGDADGGVYLSDGLSKPSSTTASSGIILHRPNAAASWISAHTTDEVLFGVSAIASNDVWAVGNNGTIVHYNGIAWQTVSSPVTANLKEVVMISPTKGWIVGDGGTILYYSNGSWQSVASPVTTDLHDISVSPSGEAWAVGDGGVILHYQPPATLTINYDNGAPGSYFTLTGSGFPANDTATIVVNGRILGTVSTDANGSFTFLLNSTGAEEGAYMITATVNPSANRWFTLNAAAPTRPMEGSGTTFVVPDGIAFDESIYLPTIIK